MQPPVIILVRPQLGENIGTTARAMHNCGLSKLRLVAPKMGWPNPHAINPAAGAVKILDDVEVFETLQEALADLNIVYATTARTRDMTKPVMTAKHAAGQFCEEIQSGSKIGVVFGPERTGLNNDDLSLIDRVISIPLNPEYTSLNLAQAVLLVAYEWYQVQGDFTSDYLHVAKGTYATKQELFEFFEQLEAELDKCGFLRVKHKRPIMVRNLRNIFLRAPLTSQEVRTLRGVVSDLVSPYTPRS